MQMKVFSRLLTQNRIISDIIALFTNIKRIEENLLQLTNLISQYESVESVVLLSLDKKNNVLRKTSVSGNADSNSQWIPELINLSQNKNFYSLIITESLFLSEQIITVENVLSQRYNWIEMNDLLFVPLKLSNSLFGLLIVKYNDFAEIDELDESFFKTLSLIIALIFKRDSDNDSLEKALLEAENANKIKTSFLANISQEIRTPVNSILGLSDLLADPDLTIDQREEFITSITKNAKALVKIFDNILDASKLDAGQLTINIEEVSWSMLFKELASEYVKLYENNKVSLVISAQSCDSDIYLKTDSYRFKQVLSYVIENAFKYTESGQVTFGYEINDEQELIVFVKDTGIGISDDIKDSVFDFFKKKQDKYFNQSGSTGLGLALANNITNLLHGKMWFVTNVNVGTTFFIKFPNTLIRCVEDNNKISKNLKYPDFSSKTFVIAEDVEINYMLISEFLAPTRAKIIWAKDGKEALEIFKTSKPDLIIMDIQMPVMNGFQAIEAIRELDKNIPIIAQTAFMMDNEKQKSIEVGANDFIPKPIKFKDLIDSIKKHL
ncbi:MAG: response regulator [Salinivirgaceae bacterium]|jgi:signal transduction histidine kinase/CheY-like chemotaxis protein|nr:response regulator [Bacteroidales bacterium]